MTRPSPSPSLVLAALLSLTLLLTLGAPDAGADVPRVVSFSGLLQDADGAPLNREVSLGLQLHLDVTNGLVLWQDVVAVTPVDGVFQVDLGRPGNPLPDDVDGPLFLEVSVDGETLDPRQPISSVPFALRAAEADRLDGLEATELDQSAAVDGLASDAVALASDLQALEDSVFALEGNPVFDLEGVFSVGLGQTAIVEGELVVQNGNVPITTVGGFVGLNVQSALQDGVRAVSVDDTGFGFGGLFMHNGPTTTSGIGVYALGNQGSAPDLVLGANSNTSSGDDGVIASDPSFSGSDILIESNDVVVIDLDADGTGSNSHLHVRAAGNSLFQAFANGSFKANGLTTAFPISVGQIRADYKVDGGFNISSVTKPIGDLQMYDVVLTSEKDIGRTVCESSTYAIHVTPGDDVDSWKAEKLCPPSNDALFRIVFRNALGIDIASEFSLVVYKL